MSLGKLLDMNCSLKGHIHFLKVFLKEEVVPIYILAKDKSEYLFPR